MGYTYVPYSESNKWRRHHSWHVPTPPNDSPGDGWCRLKSSVPITSVPPCQFEPVPEHEDDGLVTYQNPVANFNNNNWFEGWIRHDTVSQITHKTKLSFLHIQDIFKHIQFLMCILNDQWCWHILGETRKKNWKIQGYWTKFCESQQMPLDSIDSPRESQLCG